MRNLMGATLPAGKEVFWLRYAILGGNKIGAARFHILDCTLAGTTATASFGPTTRCVLALPSGSTGFHKVFDFGEPGIKFTKNPVISTSASNYSCVAGGYLE